MKLAFVLNAAYQKQYDSAQVLIPALLDDQRGTVFWEAIAYEWWGHLEALQGQIGSARDRWTRAFELSMGRGGRGTYLLRMARRAVVERLLLDDPAGAQRLLDDALALHPLEELAPLDRPYGHLAFAYAASGRPDRARELLAEYEPPPMRITPRTRSSGRREPGGSLPWLRTGRRRPWPHSWVSTTGTPAPPVPIPGWQRPMRVSAKRIRSGSITSAWWTFPRPTSGTMPDTWDPRIYAWPRSMKHGVRQKKPSATTSSS